MTGRNKQIEFNISKDPEVIFELFSVPRELREQFESLHKRSMKGGEGIIRRLKKLIGQYPHIPQLKNYLSGAYMNSEMIERAWEINHQIVQEHPDYIFGKLNLAHEHFHNEQYDRIPEVLGNMLDLRELSPGRDSFHLSEVTAFLKISIMYFCTTGDLKEAEPRFDILEELAPVHPDTEEARFYLIEARLAAIAGSMPEFTHKETEWLYENDITIQREQLATLISLPRETLISDLTMVLKDAIDRQNYFIEMAENWELESEETNFAIHAIYLLGELRATESLPLVLEALSQEEEFINFWIGDFISGSLWEPLYYIGDKQLELLKAFVLTRGFYTYARAEVCSSVLQIVHHQPHRKKEITAWFDDLFATIARTGVEQNIADSSFIGLAVYEAVALREPSLLPVIEVIYSQGLVDEFLYRSFEMIEEEMAAPPRPDSKRELMNIYDRYQQVVTTWAGYTEDEDEDGTWDEDEEELDIWDEKEEWDDDEEWEDEEEWDDEEDSGATKEFLAYLESLPDRGTGDGTGPDQRFDPKPHTPKIGRNDPCPCGSGKKYKKCCLNSEDS